MTIESEIWVDRARGGTVALAGISTISNPLLHSLLPIMPLSGVPINGVQYAAAVVGSATSYVATRRGSRITNELIDMSEAERAQRRRVVFKREPKKNKRIASAAKFAGTALAAAVFYKYAPELPVTNAFALKASLFSGGAAVGLMERYRNARKVRQP